MLAAAAALDSPAREILVAYLESERGHDRLTGGALSALGVDQGGEIPVAAAWATALGALRLAATSDPLAFACLIGFFEGPASRGMSPLAVRLAQLPDGGREASRLIERHRHINDQEGHVDVPVDVARTLPPASTVQVMQASRLLELVARSLRVYAQELSDP